MSMGMIHWSSTAVEPAMGLHLDGISTCVLLVVTVATCCSVCSQACHWHCSFCSELASRKPALSTSCFLVRLRQLSRPLIIAHGLFVCFLLEIGSHCSFFEHVISCLDSLNARITIRDYFWSYFQLLLHICVCARQPQLDESQRTTWESKFYPFTHMS